MENAFVQEQAKRVADKILRLEAYTEIQNNMGCCVLSYNYRKPEEVLSFFSSREDASLEIADEGVFRGQNIREGITYLMPSRCEPGELMDIQLASPIIEVAKDLATARTQWVCPGIGALPREGEDVYKRQRLTLLLKDRFPMRKSKRHMINTMPKKPLSGCWIRTVSYTHLIGAGWSGWRGAHGDGAGDLWGGPPKIR